jgi:hypothetical protein
MSPVVMPFAMFTQLDVERCLEHPLGQPGENFSTRMRHWIGFAVTAASFLALSG